MILYHITTLDRTEGIVENGIRPDMAVGRAKVSWWVEEDWIEWAIIHVSGRHHVPTDYLVIFTLEMNVDIGDLSTMGFRRFQRGRWMRMLVTVDCEWMAVEKYMLQSEKANP